MTGLDVGEVTVSDHEQDSVTEDWRDVFGKAQQSLDISGFTEIESEPACPFPEVTPAHYANLEGEAYTDIMAAVDYWFGRAHERKGWIEAELLCREAEFKDIVRELKKAIRRNAKTVAAKKSDMPSETEIKEEAESYQYPRELHQRITELSAMKKVVDSRIGSLERFAHGLSRQVTLRGQNIEVGGQQHRRGPRNFQR